MGYIYLFKQNGSELTKIGMTDDNDIQKRLSMFKTYSPHGAQVILTIQTSKPYEMEKKIHKLYDHKRVGGEFFNLSPAEISDIEKMFRGFDTNAVRSLFEVWIANPENDVIKLTGILSKATEEPSDEQMAILKFVSERFNGLFVTTTEVQSALADSMAIFINSTKLGIIMKSKYNYKSVRISDRVFKAYEIK